MRAAAILIVIALARCVAANAQSVAERYRDRIIEAQTAVGKGFYLEAAWAYSRAFAAGPGSDDPWTDRYEAAIVWLKASKPDSAMAQLAYLARHTGYRDFAGTELEPAFAALHGHKDWRSVMAQMRTNKHIADPATDTALADRLAYIRVEDQRPRIALEPFIARGDAASAEARALIDAMRITDAIQVRLVDSLLQRNGWMPPARIGRSGVGTVFIILQHAELPVQLRYLDMLRKAAATGELPPADLAMFEDRVALRQGGEQVYGTQIDCSGGSCQVDRLADPLRVDERRKAVGLGPIADYVQDWNIVWDAEAYERRRIAASKK